MSRSIWTPGLEFSVVTGPFEKHGLPCAFSTFAQSVFDFTLSVRL